MSSTSSNPSTLYAIHGLESHAGWFAPLAHALATQPHPILLTTIARTPRDRATRAEEWLDHLSANIPDNANVLAHSWGAKLLAFALARGALRPASVILLTPALVIQSDLATPSAWASLRIPIDEDRYSTDPPVLEFLAHDEHRLRDITPSFLAADLRMTREALQSPPFSVPTLAITTRHDRIVDTSANDGVLHRLFPDHTHHAFDEHGHLVLLEAPTAIASTVAAWLQSR